MSSEQPIETDVFCYKCGYNLRGLSVVHRCPECEFPTMRSVILTRMKRKRNLRDPVSRLVWGRRAESFAADILAPLLEIDRKAILFAMACAKKRVGKRNGGGMCQAIIDGSVRYFKDADAARSALRSWGIKGSADIGRIVAGLVESGLLLPSENDSPADFANVISFNEWI